MAYAASSGAGSMAAGKQQLGAYGRAAPQPNAGPGPASAAQPGPDAGAPPPVQPSYQTDPNHAQGTQVQTRTGPPPGQVADRPFAGPPGPAPQQGPAAAQNTQPTSGVPKPPWLDGGNYGKVNPNVQSAIQTIARQKGGGGGIGGASSMGGRGVQGQPGSINTQHRGGDPGTRQAGAAIPGAAAAPINATTGAGGLQQNAAGNAGAASGLTRFPTNTPTQNLGPTQTAGAQSNTVDANGRVSYTGPGDVFGTAGDILTGQGGVGDPGPGSTTGSNADNTAGDPATAATNAANNAASGHGGGTAIGDAGAGIAGLMGQDLGKITDQMNQGDMSDLQKFYGSDFDNLGKMQDAAQQNFSPEARNQAEAAARSQMMNDVGVQRDAAERQQMARQSRGGAMSSGGETGIYNGAMNSMASGERGLQQDKFGRDLAAGNAYQNAMGSNFDRSTGLKGQAYTSRKQLMGMALDALPDNFSVFPGMP